MRRTLMVMIFSCLVVSPALGQDKSQWRAKYMAGARKDAVGAKVTLSVSPQGVLCKKGKNVVLQVPIESVAQVGYDTQAHNKGWAVLKSGSGGSSGEAATVVFITAAILAPFKTTRHFIRILWQQDGEPQEALLEVGKGDYSAVLAQFQAVTGKPWQNLPEARQKLRMELEEAKGRKLLIQVDRAAVVNEAELKPGPYQIVFLNRAEDRGEVYFFKGQDQDVDTGRIAAQAVVNVKATEDPSLPVAVGYATQEGVETISSIRLPEKTLSFIADRLPARVEKSAHSFYAGSGKWAVVTWAEYQGEPAFLFHVAYLQVLRVCEGQLFVTRTRVALEMAPINAGSHCDTFSAPRSEVKASVLTGKWTNKFFSLSVAGKSRSFQPVLEGPPGSNRIAQLGKSREAARDWAAFLVKTVSDFDAVQRESRPPAPPQP
jgi:hypothetical protein